MVGGGCPRYAKRGVMPRKASPSFLDDCCGVRGGGFNGNVFDGSVSLLVQWLVLVGLILIGMVAMRGARHPLF